MRFDIEVTITTVTGEFVIVDADTREEAEAKAMQRVIYLYDAGKVTQYERKVEVTDVHDITPRDTSNLVINGKHRVGS